ncbi:hypothetical protein GCM10020221_01370 [Streptomyces thioluteus]|uniref:Uncharacterized protein n=1 Tax=Streptomyces thioluteus TaxID=66431 RepID=A0ABP6ITF6_STRTU
MRGTANRRPRQGADHTAAKDQVPEGTVALIYNSQGQYLLHLRDNIPDICGPGT